MRFDLTTLCLVLAIEQTRSITRGAEREHLALAAASKRLADLECRLGVPLFVRRARGVEPTQAGIALVRHIRSLQDTLNALETEVAEFASGLKGRVRVGATAGAIAQSLPGDLAAFSRRYPEVQVSLVEMSSADGVRAVADESIDIGVFELQDDEPQVEAWRYQCGRLGLLVSESHELASAKQVSLDDLLDEQLILHSAGDRVYELLARAASSRDKRLSVRFFTKEVDAIVQLVQRGLGVAVIPDSLDERVCHPHRTRLLKLGGDWADVEYSVCVARREQLPVVTRKLVECLSSRAVHVSELKAA